MTTTNNDDDAATSSGAAGRRGRCMNGGPGFGPWAYGRGGRSAQGFAPGAEGMHFGPPLPVKVLGVLLAFAAFKPLGVAALAFLGWQAWQRHNHGEPAFGRFGGAPGMGVENSAFTPTGREWLASQAEELAAINRQLDEAAEPMGAHNIGTAIAAFRAALFARIRSGGMSEGEALRIARILDQARRDIEQGDEG